MQVTVYNPQKGRLETIDAEFTEENTTWFAKARNPRDVSRITDRNGDLLIYDLDYSYPILIYGVSRADIGFDPRKAKQLRRQHE
jgi:hypothetical protein